MNDNQNNNDMNQQPTVPPMSQVGQEPQSPVVDSPTSPQGDVTGMPNMDDLNTQTPAEPTAPVGGTQMPPASGPVAGDSPMGGEVNPMPMGSDDTNQGGGQQ